MLIDVDRPNWLLCDRFDGWGLAGLAGVPGGMEGVPDEGPSIARPSDPTVATPALIMEVGSAATFRRAFTRNAPSVRCSAS